MPLPPLSPDQKIKPRHFELRMAVIFFAILIPNGIHLPYFSLWLAQNRFDPQQIAVILSAPMFLRVVTTPFITAFADAARDRAYVMIALVAASALCAAGYFLEPAYVMVLAVSLALTVVWTPQSPIADSLALSGVRRFGSKYTGMRIWGSISFLLANLAGGLILARTGTGAVPAIIFATFGVALLVVLIAPRLGRPPHPHGRVPGVLSRLRAAIFRGADRFGHDAVAPETECRNRRATGPFAVRDRAGTRMVRVLKRIPES